MCKSLHSVIIYILNSLPVYLGLDIENGNWQCYVSSVVCGPPGLSVHDLLASNLTWVASDLLTSDVCHDDPTLLEW